MNTITPPAADFSSEAPVGRHRVLWARVKHELRHSPLFLIGTIIVAIAIFLAIFGPAVAPQNPTSPNPLAISQPPSSAHWFGTDNSGLDVFSRVIAAPRVDVSIALAAVLVSILAGSIIGLIGSFFRGPWGAITMRIADVVQAFPLFVLAMVIVVTAGRSMVALVVVLAFLNVPIYIRLMRSEVLALKDRSFVEAARATGLRESQIAIRHVYPNAISSSLVQASITMGWAIIATAGLSFVGAGIRPPTAEWGSMIAVGAQGISQGEWWSAIFPGIAMSLTVFGFAALGEGIRRAMRRGT